MKLEQQVEELFQAAVDLDPPSRTAFLARRCGSRPQLRSRVEALLDRHDRAEDLAPPALDWDAESELYAEGPGTVIERYRLVQQIGEGGFGVVYQAEQESPVRRKVALKIIKLGMDTKEVVARFEAERQALAMMDHPGIAKVLDGGATELGRPYFVMELVPGISITKYCDQHRRTPRERLELFCAVLDAVQHAHQKGIIHRDLKPTNVLVSLHDGKPVPKIIDFGIAKAIHRRLTEKTVFTEYRQLIGTPDYMSPEQAEVSGLDIDTRTDIYSLGVLLQELLTGTTPFDLTELGSKGYAEIQRRIREEEPSRPSARFAALGERAKVIAERRGVDGPTLGRLLRGDLDWIVLKCLEKDPTRRYESAGSFAEDIRRYLRNDPVHATPPSSSYRLRKFLRRNRAAVASGVVVSLALLLGTVGAVLGMLQAAAERDEAQRERRAALAAREDAEKEAKRAQAVTRFLTNTLALADPEVALGEDISMRTILDRASSEVDHAFAGQPRAEATVRTIIGRAYASLGNEGLAEKHLRRAAELMEEQPDVPQQDLYRTLWRLTDVAFKLERNDAWSLARRSRRLGHDIIAQRDPVLATALNGFIEAVEASDVARAERELREASRRAADSLVAGEFEWQIMADTLVAAGLTLWYSPFEAASREFYRRALEIQRQELPPTHPEIGVTLSHLVGVLNRAGEFEESEALIRESIEILRQVLDEDHLQIAYSKSQLGECLVGQGRFEEADELLVRAHLAIVRAQGKYNFYTVDSIGRIIRLYDAWEKPARALPWRTELADICERSKHIMPWPISRLVFAADQGRLVERVDRFCALAKSSEEPEPAALASLLEEIAAARAAALPVDDRLCALLGRLFIFWSLEWGHLPPAARHRLTREGLVMLEEWRSRFPIDLAAALAQESLFLGREGRSEASVRRAREARDLLLQDARGDYWYPAYIQTRIGRSYLEQGQLDAAQPLLWAGFELLDRQLGRSDRHTAEAWSYLVELFRAQGKTESQLERELHERSQ